MTRVWTIVALLLALGAPAADAQGKDGGRDKSKAEKRWEERRAVKAEHPQARTWRRGEVLPPAYRGAVLDDPHRHGLYAPPKGHAWVRVGEDAYLTTTNNGQIVKVVRDTLQR